MKNFALQAIFPLPKKGAVGDQYINTIFCPLFSSEVDKLEGMNGSYVQYYTTYGSNLLTW